MTRSNPIFVERPFTPDQLRTASIYPLKTLTERVGYTLPIVVMRYWPRGVSKVNTTYIVMRHEPELAPSVELLKRYQQGMVDWEAFAAAYCEEQQLHINKWRRWVRGVLRWTSSVSAITLLCHEHDAPEETVRCHRRLLRDMLLESEAQP